MTGYEWIAALPVLLVLVLFGGMMSRIALRIIIEAVLGYKRMSDRAVRDVAGAAVRTASLVYGLGYLGVSWAMQPFGRVFVRIECWVEVRMEEPVPVTGAQQILGLSSGFTRDQFEDRYRAVISVVHPDKGGSDWLATAVNNAKDAIKKERGWK